MVSKYRQLDKFRNKLDLEGNAQFWVDGNIIKGIRLDTGDLEIEFLGYTVIIEEQTKRLKIKDNKKNRRYSFRDWRDFKVMLNDIYNDMFGVSNYLESESDYIMYERETGVSVILDEDMDYIVQYRKLSQDIKDKFKVIQNKYRNITYVLIEYLMSNNKKKYLDNRLRYVAELDIISEAKKINLNHKLKAMSNGGFRDKNLVYITISEGVVYNNDYLNYYVFDIKENKYKEDLRYNINRLDKTTYHEYNEIPDKEYKQKDIIKTYKDVNKYIEDRQGKVINELKEIKAQLERVSENIILKEL